jgi:hypothetical protein
MKARAWCKSAPLSPEEDRKDSYWLPDIDSFVPTNDNQANLKSKVVLLSSLIAVAVDAHQASLVAQDVNI